MSPKPSEAPVARVRHLARAHRVVVEILEYFEEGFEPIDDAGKESAAPEMTGHAMAPVPGHCVDAHDPLHDPREVLFRAGTDHEVEVVSHDAEVIEPEVVPLPRPAERADEERLHGGSLHHELLAVRARRDVVQRSCFEKTWFAHDVAPPAYRVGACDLNRDNFFVASELCPCLIG